MKLSHFDRTLIHGLGVMSRPPIHQNPEHDRMVVDIISKCAPRVSSHDELRPLLREARRLSENLGPQRYIAHHIEAAMNDFDRMCMAVHWDAARRG